MIYDPSTSYEAVQEQIPAVQFVDYWKGLMPFNDSFSAQLHNMSDSCGYTDYLSTYLTFPPPGPFPTQLPGTDEDGNTFGNCHVFDAIYNEVFYINPCWDIYQVRSSTLLFILDFAVLIRWVGGYDLPCTLGCPRLSWVLWLPS